MATIILQAVGTAVGAAVGGPLGAMVGRTLGALGGAYLDQQLFGPGDRHTTGPRMDSAQVLSSREGASIPKVYGRARVSGEIIWATRFEEVQSVETQSQGGKGGGSPKTTVTSFSYFANFAIGLCEGPVAGTGRIWADGKLLDQTEYNLRLHRGGNEQSPDSLVQAKQGGDNTPAYRGIAYLVFEHFPLEDYGNRIPQIAVEIIRPVGMLEKHIYAVNMIPGGTEFGYDTVPVIESRSVVGSVKLNVNQPLAETDFLASLDELITVCPNLRQISLVVAWFGNDLRVGHCQVRPAVEVSQRDISSGDDWVVAGINRQAAPVVSQYEGAPALGGTPSDGSVLRAIQAIKGRGLQVCLNPFLMMDIGAGNGLPDPYGQVEQGAYPWRGRITCDPAQFQPGTPDQTNAVRSQIDSFVGDAQSAQFVQTANGVSHTNQTQWSYRRMILHYAHLAQVAGSVDMFLIGSEMRGLTSVRAANHTFPFVDALVELANDVAEILSPSCTVTYGADWSEYFGYHPNDGSQNAYFNLDPLWASSSIGAIGIDNYMPLSDWRAEGEPADLGRSSTDPAMLGSQIAAGEGYDWYYQNEEHRLSGNRSPITDGSGKPWVFRYKDLHSWWSNPHFDRHGGQELIQATPWVPQSKPIIFTEFGAPAVHNGAAQPNVFVDPKSAESHLPHFSNGTRDDLAQVNYIAAHQKHWDGACAGFVAANNPTSAAYVGRMVDFERSQLWAWDARPYPVFPNNIDLWVDGKNWHTGHWLNGRLGNVRIADLLSELMRENQIEQFDVEQVAGAVDGYVIADISSARSALEVVLSLLRIVAYEDGGVLHFRSPGYDKATYLSLEDIVHASGEAVVSSRKEHESDIAVSVHFQHIDPGIEFQETESSAGRINRTRKRQQFLSGPIVLSQDRMRPLLEGWLQDRWASRETISIAISNRRSDLTVGDDFVLDASPLAQRWRVQKVEQASEFRISAKAVEQGELHDSDTIVAGSRESQRSHFGKPHLLFLDLPILPGQGEAEGNKIAGTASPWPGPLAVYSSPSDEGYLYRQLLINSAFSGKLMNALPGTLVTSRWNLAHKAHVELYHGQLSSAPQLGVLNGINSVALRSENGSWEILQYSEAELIGDKTWVLSKLLRGQLGTEVEASYGATEGADIVVLNQAVVPLENAAADRGLEMNWLAGPVGKALDSPEFSSKQFTPGYRSLAPYRPVHLRAEKENSGDIVLNWARRDRIAADDWAPVEIPQSENIEQYRVVLSSPAQATMEVIVSATTLTISASELASSFGPSPATLDISVSQMSATVGVGPSANITI